MTVYLVRHAKAGSRSDFNGPDWLRPLTTPGQAQARELLRSFTDSKFARIFASPYVRCMETVVPLASHHGLAVSPHDALAEGATPKSTLQLFEECLDEGAVLCSHGDIIPILLEGLAALGVDLGPHPRCEKGCVWVLEGNVLGPTMTATYWPPPIPR